MEKQLFFPFWSTSISRIPDKQFIQKLSDLALAPETTLSEEDLVRTIDEYEQRGFLMLQEWTQGFHSPERILCPSGEIFNYQDLFKRKNVDNLNHLAQQERLDAIKYWRLVDSDKYQFWYLQYPSFLDNEDEVLQRKKWMEKIRSYKK